VLVLVLVCFKLTLTPPSKHARCTVRHYYSAAVLPVLRHHFDHRRGASAGAVINQGWYVSISTYRTTFSLLAWTPFAAGFGMQTEARGGSQYIPCETASGAAPSDRCRKQTSTVHASFHNGEALCSHRLYCSTALQRTPGRSHAPPPEHTAHTNEIPNPSHTTISKA
jgi:hypothetical protein